MNNAFPYNEKIYEGDGIYSYHSYPGMTFRDFLASQALVGIVTTMTNSNWGLIPENCAKQAYEIADAMIKAREA